MEEYKEISWEDAYPNEETRSDMQFYSRYLSQEQDRKRKERAKEKKPCKILRENTEI